MSERTIPVCFTKDQIRELEEYAKARGMLSLRQAVDHAIANHRSKKSR